MSGLPVVALAEAASRPPFDVIVVGSGACGSFAARTLTEQGLQVAVVEAGPAVAADLLDPADEPHPLLHAKLIPERQRTQAQHPDFFRRNPRLFVDDRDHPYSTPPDAPFNWIRGRQVGGRTLTWGGVTVRMSPHELQSWPVSYQELAPHYEQVERFLGVRGARDGLPQLPDGACENPCQLTPGELRFQAAVRARWPERQVICARGVPTRLPGDDPAAWPRHTSQGNALASALRSGRAVLVPDAIVHEVLISTDTARARGVSALDGTSGLPYELRARAVVLAASTLETTRIMLNSRPRQHAAGLGNSSGLLGSFLMDHPCTSIYGAIPDLPSLDPPPPLRGPDAIMIPRFTNLDRADRPFAGGFGLFGGIQRRAFNSAVFSRGPAKIVLMAYGEMLPHADNRVTIDPDVVDRHGVPSLHIRCAWSDNERALIADMERTLVELLDVVGARIASDPPKLPVPGSMVHEVGTARMGRDPRTSVLDADNRCWDADNVLVVDGACWPSCGWQNPTLTMMALAVRASEKLGRSFKSAQRQ